MDTLPDVLRSCKIIESGPFVRAVVGPGTDEAIQDCYRTVAVLCIEHGIQRALLIGADGDAAAHRALVSGLRCAALAGLPPDFMLALVAEEGAVREVFRQAEREAASAGISARLFLDEGNAIGWLLAGERARP